MDKLLHAGLSILRGACRSVNRSTVHLSAAPFSTTAPVHLREIQVETKENVTTIQGKKVENDGSDRTLTIPGEQTCPMCQLNMKVKYTDVLILHQFVREDGCLLPRRLTGVCMKQQNRLKTLVRQAQRAGLMPNYRPPLKNGRERQLQLSSFEWKKYPAYFEEQ